MTQGKVRYLFAKGCLSFACVTAVTQEQQREAFVEANGGNVLDNAFHIVLVSESYKKGARSLDLYILICTFVPSFGRNQRIAMARSA